MAPTDSKDPKEQPASATGGSRSPSAKPTIDLKASEVKETTAKDGSGSGPGATKTGAKSAASGSGANAPKTAANTSPSNPSKPAATGGMGALMPAAIGGVVGAALVYGLVQLGVLPSGGGDGGETLQSEIATLRQSVAELSEQESAAPAFDPSDLEAALATLRTDMEALQSSDATADGAAVAALEGRLAALEDGAQGADGDGALLATRIDTIAAESAATNQEFEALKARIETLDAASGENGVVVDLTPLESRLAALEEAAGNSDLTSLDTRLTAVEEAVTTVDDKISEAVAAVPTSDTSTLETDLAALGESQTSLSSRVDGLEQSVGALSASVDQIATSVDELSSASSALDGERRQAYLVALSGLQRAAAGSGPFATELAAVTELSGDSAPFSAIAPLADSGVPSTAALARTFGGLTGAILDAAAKADADGVISRLAAGAQSLVRIRPTGYVAGDSPSATVARIEALLRDGKLPAALDEWETLPDAGKAASEDWAQAARDRVTLNAALSGASATN